MRGLRAMSGGAGYSRQSIAPFAKEVNLLKHLPILAASLALLAGCGGEEPAPESDASASAMGEVLEGSTSDAMLPYGNLRSQPPLAEISDIPESEGGPSAPAGADDQAGEGDGADDSATSGNASPDTPAQSGESEPAETQPAD